MEDTRELDQFVKRLVGELQNLQERLAKLEAAGAGLSYLGVLTEREGVLTYGTNPKRISLQLRAAPPLAAGYVKFTVPGYETGPQFYLVLEDVG